MLVASHMGIHLFGTVCLAYIMGSMGTLLFKGIQIQ